LPAAILNDKGEEMKDRSRSKRRGILGLVYAASALLCGILILGSAIAIAAHPAKGKTYRGEINRVFGGKVVSTYPISFKVSSNGKKVSKFNLPEFYPVYCQGGGFGEALTTTERITSKGTFKAKLPIYFKPSHSHEGFLKISGTFGAQKRETGKVTTDFTKSKTCNGTSKYMTKG
jgi:hypothetical protein